MIGKTKNNCKLKDNRAGCFLFALKFAIFENQKFKRRNYDKTIANKRKSNKN